MSPSLTARVLALVCLGGIMGSAINWAAAQTPPPPKRYRYDQKNMADTSTASPPLKKRIAVARFDDSVAVDESPFGTLDPVTAKKHQNDDINSPLSNDLAVIRRGFTERLITAMFATDRFVVIERRDIHKILREQEFARSGRTSPAGAIPTNEVLSAQYILTGMVTANQGESEDTSSDSDVEMALPIPGSAYRIGVGSGRATGADPGATEVRGAETQVAGDRSILDKEAEFNCPRASRSRPATYAVHLRVYDVTTSQIVSAVRASADSQWCLIKAAVSRLVNQMEKFPWKTRVAAVEGNQVIIEGGRDVNMSHGARLTHLAPHGREVLSRSPLGPGELSVVEVREVTSVVRPISRPDVLGIQAGDWMVQNPAQGTR